MPYPIRSIKAPYLWVFYKQLSSFNPDEIVFIGSNEYKNDPSSFNNRFETNLKSCISNGYELPTISEINSYAFYEFSNEIFTELDVKNQFNTNKVFFELLTKEISEISLYLEKLLIEIKKTYEIIGLLSWCNFPSLNSVSNKLNIPVVYNELGALRKPHYLQTAYFDFMGVNGNTESKSRFLSFKKNSDKINIYSLEEIKDIIFNVDFIIDKSIESFEVGIALQVEDDSNILAYSKGFDSISLIRWVKDKYKTSNILIREHPSSFLSYKKFGKIDSSLNSFSFISKCNSIATINSSVALEGLLLDKKVDILGDSPFSFINEINNSNEKLLALNFAIFGYMIPYKLLFNYDYYIWRLSNPSENEIFNKHINFYIQEIENRKKKELRVKDFYVNFIQLFIENENGFSEESSIKFPILENNQIQKFEFDLKNDKDIKSLRLDPLNDSCVIEIEKLCLLQKDGKEIDLVSLISSNICSIQDKNYFFETFDSQIYFENLDLEVLKFSDKLYIELKYNHVSKDAVHVCVNQIITDKNYKISLLEKEKIGLEESLSNMEEKVLSVENELISIYTSKSWKITRPLRNIIRKIKNLKKGKNKDV